MKITVGIPTLNRSHSLIKLYESLTAQTDKDFSVLVVDDGSKGNTPVPLQLDAQLYRTHPYREPGKMYDSMVPDNVIFKEAGCDVLIHLDDDGVVHPGLVARVREQFTRFQAQVLYGRITSVDTLDRVRIVDDDVRMKELKNHNTMFKLEPDCGFHFGAIWAAPMKVLWDMGGHDMRWIGSLGCDARLGFRLAKMLVSYFHPDPETTFTHVGLSKYRERKLGGRMTEVYENWLAPQLSNCDNPVVANGGVVFWQNFPIRYERLV